MRKQLLARLFAGGVAGLGAGLLLGGASAVLAIWGDVYVYEGSAIVGLRMNGAGLVMAMLAGPAGVVGVCAALTLIVAWFGALVNAWRLPTRAWFALLLVLGLPTLGLLPMVPYLVLAPEAGGIAPAAAGTPRSRRTARS